MRKLGFKFFSNNFQMASATLKECADFVAGKQDMFIELMVVPSSDKDDLMKIKQLLGDTEVRIHAPYMGFDTGCYDKEAQNRKILAGAQEAADIFASPTIVVHCGCGHGEKYVAESARQFRLFHDERVVVENLPYYGNDGSNLHGSAAAEIAYIMNESGCGFCFDFSHAICAALSLHKEVETQLKDFYALRPQVYHICDGDLQQDKDIHLHLGDGNYPLRHYLTDYTADDAYITIETGRGFEQHNDLRIKDYEYIKSILKNPPRV